MATLTFAIYPLGGTKLVLTAPPYLSRYQHRSASRCHRLMTHSYKTLEITSELRPRNLPACYASPRPWCVDTPTQLPFHISHTTPTITIYARHRHWTCWAEYIFRPYLEPPIACLVLSFLSLTPIALVVSLQAAVHRAAQIASWSRNACLLPWPKY